MKKTSQFHQSDVDMSNAMELHSVCELKFWLKQSVAGLLAPLKASRLNRGAKMLQVIVYSLCKMQLTVIRG